MKDVFQELGLSTLAQQLPTVLETARHDQPTYEAFLHQALQAEVQGRAQRAHDRRLRAAKLPITKTLESFEFAFQPTISEPLLRELGSLAFVPTATNVIFLGPPGVGKTHLATALAVRAVQAGHSALFTTLSQLAEGLDGHAPLTSWQHRLRKYLLPKVLVIDEVGYTRLSPSQAHALFELVTARYEHGSILLTSNTSFAEWGNLLGNEVLATALLDRLLHHADVIAINGPSYRMRQRSTTRGASS